MKRPLYTLPGGIEVITEYPAREKNRYRRLLITAHPLFDAKVVSGRMLVRKSRVIATSMLGRKLEAGEHVHHKDENVENDSPENLEIISAADHNKHHKIGAAHSDESKAKISASLADAYRSGKKVASRSDHWIGKKHSRESREKMSHSRKSLIASGKIKKSIPPVNRGEMSRSVLRDEDVLRIRQRANNGESKRAMSSEYGVALQTIYNIINRTTWSHI